MNQNQLITYDDEHHRFGIIVMPVANRSNAPGVSTVVTLLAPFKNYMKLIYALRMI